MEEKLITIHGVDMSFKIPANMEKSKMDVGFDTYDSDDMTIIFHYDKRGYVTPMNGSPYFRETEKFDLIKVEEMFRIFLKESNIKYTDIEVITDNAKEDVKLIVLKTVNEKSTARIFVYETSSGNNMLIIVNLNNLQAQKEVESLEKSIRLKKSSPPSSSQKTTNSQKEKFSIKGKNMYLPVFQEYTDYYSNEIIKNQCDYSVGNGGNNVIGAVYYNNRDMAIINSALNSDGDFDVDDYFIVCYTKGLNKKEIKISDFSGIINDMKKYMSVDTNWDIVLSKVEDLDVGYTLSKPIVIDEYKITENAHAFVFLMKAATSQGYKLTISYYNLVLINERVINVYYYFEYKDDKSIKNSKANNLYVVHSMLKAN